MSIQVTSCFPRNTCDGVLGVPQASLSEPGAVSLLQPQPDLRHHSVHFGVRQGALRASESQGKCDALVTLGYLRPAVLVERASGLEQLSTGFLDRLQKRR